jgi:hypothetical protein
MDIDLNVVMLSLIPSGIGFVLFVYGKKQHRWPQLVSGIILMVYPYFTGTVTSLLAVGAACGVGLYLMLAAGW